MTRVENDTTRNPIPAIILAGPRTGGTFLAHGLSNHPNIYCERQEVMHINSSYRLPAITLQALDILNIIWGQSGYIVAMGKLQYAQARYPGAWAHIKERGARVIHLRRRNKLRQAISLMINEMARAGAIPFHPQHARVTPKHLAVMISPDQLKATAQRLIREETKWQSRLLESGLPVLQLSYRQIIGEGVISAQRIAARATKRLCDFLGVMAYPLPAALRRINPWPLDEMVTNWRDVEPLLGKAEFKDCSVREIE